jgi:hypothetical protein
MSCSGYFQSSRNSTQNCCVPSLFQCCFGPLIFRWRRPCNIYALSLSARGGIDGQRLDQFTNQSLTFNSVYARIIKHLSTEIYELTVSSYISVYQCCIIYTIIWYNISVAGLQDILNLCFETAPSLDFNFNLNKSHCTSFGKSAALKIDPMGLAHVKLPGAAVLNT